MSKRTRMIVIKTGDASARPVALEQLPHDRATSIKDLFVALMWRTGGQRERE